MKLSIIIPVYNCEKYIDCCLNSILGNNYYDFELVIINDGSTDNSQEIIENRKDKRIKLFNNKNHGVSYSRNYGLKKSSGEYIMFVDADDFLDSKWHNNVIRELNDDDFYIFSSKKISNIKNVLLRQIAGVNGDGIIIAAPFSKVYKKDLLQEKNIMFNEKIINGEDMLFNLKSIKESKSFKIINSSFYKYRINYGSATKSFNEKILESDKQFQLELGKLTDDEIIINSSGCNGLYTLIDRICYVKKYKNAKLLFNKIDIKFYDKYDLKYLNKKKIKIINLLKKKRYLIVFNLLRLKHYIASKIRKEYIKEI